MDSKLQDRVELAHYIASNAGSVITDLYHKKIRTEQKEVNDFVTELDKSIESMALKTIKQKFPGDGFYGEENLSIDPENGFEWIVDPIDGTNNYIRGLPLCGFQVALVDTKEVVFGLIHRPLTQEIYTATKGGGAHYENRLTGERRKLSVSSRNLASSIGIFDAKVGKSGNPSSEILKKLIDKINMVRVFGVAVFDLPAVAEGSVEFLVSGIARKYDIAPGMLLIKEAGGVAYASDGSDISIEDDLTIFSGPHIKDEIVRLLEP